VRFLVQAANGVGAVGLDTADGGGYQVPELGALPTYSLSSPSVTEGDFGTRNLVFEVTLSDPAPVDLAFTPSISGGTATSGVDYVTPDLTNGVVVPAGELSAEVTLAVLGDTTVEPDETVRLAVTPANGSPLAPDPLTGVGTIISDDLYSFGGFLAPVDPQPVVNQVKAGQSVPVKLSLGGYRGLDVLLAGSPTFRSSPCDTSDVIDVIESTTTANSGLTYDASRDTYTYVWKTSSAWRGKCGVLSLAFADGTTRQADFKFK